jgi:parvulin-like peptidyl-prolyl isomerase
VIAIAAGIIFGLFGYRFDFSKTVATVDGIAIKQSEIDNYIEYLKSIYPTNFPTESDPDYRIYQITILDTSIQLRLLKKYAEANDLAVTKKEIDDAYQNIVSQYPSVADFEKDLAAEKITTAFVRSELKKQLLTNKVLTKLAADITISDVEMQKYYQDNKNSLFNVPEQIRISHILIKFNIPSGGTITDQIKTEALKKITEVNQKLKNGQDFAELAKANSEDTTSAVNSGDIGYISKGQTVPEFENVAFSLKVGEVSGIVETGYGYHIIKVTDHKDPYIETYDEVKDTIKSSIQSDKQRKIWEDFINSLVAKANIAYLTDLKGTLGPQGVPITTTTNTTEPATTTTETTDQSTETK